MVQFSILDVIKWSELDECVFRLNDVSERTHFFEISKTIPEWFVALRKCAAVEVLWVWLDPQPTFSRVCCVVLWWVCVCVSAQQQSSQDEMMCLLLLPCQNAAVWTADDLLVLWTQGALRLCRHLNGWSGGEALWLDSCLLEAELLVLRVRMSQLISSRTLSHYWEQIRSGNSWAPGHPEPDPDPSPLPPPPPPPVWTHSLSTIQDHLEQPALIYYQLHYFIYSWVVLGCDVAAPGGGCVFFVSFSPQSELLTLRIFSSFRLPPPEPMKKFNLQEHLKAEITTWREDFFKNAKFSVTLSFF